MKIVICWSNYSGYWAACWRRLASIPGVELFVLAFTSPAASPFDASLLDGIPHRLLDDAERKDAALITRLVAEQAPDAIQIVGWFVPAYRAVAQAPTLALAKVAISVDTPWLSQKQILTRWRYRSFFAHVDGVGATGERRWQNVRRLGFAPDRIRRHMYGVDEELAARIHAARAADPSPKRAFLFVGRYALEKGLDVLVEGYRRYRAQSVDPWEMICCGRGPEDRLLKGQPGIRDLGFVQPSEMAERFRTAGAYVISSRFDPWPLTIPEAALAGLPVIASDACGSAVEIVRPHYNGVIVPSGDAEGFARAMLQMESAPLEQWGDRAREHAAPFTASLWAERWHALFVDLLDCAGAAPSRAAAA